MARNIFLILFIFFCSQGQASFSCNLTKLLGHEKLAGNSQFWEDLGKIKHTDSELEKLIQMHAPDLLTVAPTAGTAANIVRRAFVVNKSVEKSLAKIKSTNAYKRYEEFLDIITDPNKGLDALSKTKPGLDANGAKAGWKHETLRENKNHHTVRLDDGNRLLFEVRPDGVHILDMGNHVSH